MKELSLHILDIVQNSISAGANLIKITVNEETKENDILEIIIEDNGCGMDADEVEKALDPFYTSRTTRKVGLGLPLFRQAAQLCGGDLWIVSKKGEGTTVRVSFKHSHIDRAPLGDMVSTLLALITLNPEIDFIYEHYKDRQSFTLDTREIKEVLNEVPVTNPIVVNFLKQMLQENFQNLNGGAC